MDLFFLDETGFALTQPPTHTWCHCRQRPFVPYAYRQGPRVNVLAARATPGTTPTQPLTWWATDRSWKGEDLVGFLQHTLPGDGQRPRVVVLDNASSHRSTTIREVREVRAQQHRIHLWYLPPTAPS